MMIGRKKKKKKKREDSKDGDMNWSDGNVWRGCMYDLIMQTARWPYKTRQRGSVRQMKWVERDSDIECYIISTTNDNL